MLHQVTPVLIMCQGFSCTFFRFGWPPVGTVSHAGTMSQAKVNLVGNPVRTARRSLGKSISKIAHEAGVHEQAWYLTECGCYSQIPPKIRLFLQHRTELNLEEYQTFRIQTQRLFGEAFLSKYKLPEATIRLPPLEAFIQINEIPNRTFFAKALCVQPSLVYRTLLGSARELPSQIREALKEAGVSEDDVYELNERTIEYYESWPLRTQKSRS